MQITILTLAKASYALTVLSTHSIQYVMDLIKDQTGIPTERIRLTFAGKELHQSHTLIDYGISDQSTLHMLLRTPSETSDLTEMVRQISEDNAFPTYEEALQRVKDWRSLAEKGNFDADIHILDPHAYYTLLDCVERQVVLRSQWLRQGGDLAGFGSENWAMIYELESMPSIPPWIRDLVRDITANGKRLVNRTPTTLCEIYRTIAGLIGSIDLLEEQKLCNGYYSILIERNQGTVAELVRIKRSDLTGFREGLEVAMTFVSEEEMVDAEEESEMVTQCLMAPVENMLVLLGAKNRFPSVVSLDEVLNLCRMLAYLLDLGMVFYIGAHASTLDMLASDQEINGMGLGLQSALNFTCSKQPLACLSGFLDAKSVWVFRLGKRIAHFQTTKLSILTTIDVLADVWGPVWAEGKDPTLSGQQQNITKYHVSKGCIRRVRRETASGVPGAIRCHWTEELTMSVDDKLLIGTELRLNSSCKYTLQEYEMSYGQLMRTLGPRPSTWKLDGATIAVQVAAPKVVTFQIQGNVKKVPETTIKQFIMDKWRFEPERANPGILNSYFGAEVSHCTGNTRRVPLKAILLMPCVQNFLERQIPGWASTRWGMAFIKAMQTESCEGIFKFWIDYSHERPLVGQLVRSVLDVLDNTGKDDRGFYAGFLHGNSELGINIDERNNEWIGVLKDSYLTAIYAIVNEACLECRQPDHTASICNDEARHTVLQTQVGLKKGERLKERLKVEPHDQTFRRASNHPISHGTTQFLLPEISLKRALLGSYNLAVAKELSIQLECPSQNVAKVTLRASGQSYGGMEYKRERTMLDTEADQSTTTPLDNGLVAVIEGLSQIEIEGLIREQQMQEGEHMICET